MFRLWSRGAQGKRGRRRDGRRARRYQSNVLSCDLGQVVDISRTGMRVRCASKPPIKLGQTLPLSVQSQEQRVRVSAVPVWIKRRGLRSHQVGLRFVNITLSMSAALEAMATFGFVDLDAAARHRREGGGPVRMSFELPDYYQVLEVSRAASLKEIQAAYRTLARKYHPDVCDDPATAERFMRITEAYDVLRDPQSRKSYDQHLRLVG
jgi:hypothetical protein